MIAEVEVVVVVAVAEEIVMHSRVAVGEIVMRSRTERRAPVHLRKRRNRRLT
jgi:hypothetical protein